MSQEQDVASFEPANDSDNKNTHNIHLKIQDLTKLDVTKLTPSTPEVISRQATINIGTLGHVAHGKSTLVKGLSGVQTVRFKNELERNITIKLGYANIKVYECNNIDCPRPDRFWSAGSGSPDELSCRREECTGKLILKRHISALDVPGHDCLMSTMLNGAAVMDGAMLLIAGNEECPQPQTLEHLAAAEIVKLKHLITVQNKVDLISEQKAEDHHKSITDFLKGTIGENSPIVPLSAQLKYNLDVICEYLCNIPLPVRDFTSPARMTIVRSFDVNKPGTTHLNLKGGVAGGTVSQGVLKIGDKIEIRPGIVSKNTDGKIVCRPLFSQIVSLLTEANQLQYAVPGGLIGVGTEIDPSLCRADRLVGQILGAVGSLPNILIELEINFQLLKRLLGSKTKDKVLKMEKAEILMLNIGSSSTNGIVIAVKKDLAKIKLARPVCAEINEKISISRRGNDNRWRLIGYGSILAGKSVEILD